MTAGPSPYRLADAISGMTMRYGQAERQAVYAWSRYMTYPADAERHLAEHQRWERAALRRYKAVHRLVNALRDLNGGEPR